MDDYPERFYSRFETYLGWALLYGVPLWAGIYVYRGGLHAGAPRALFLAAQLLILCLAVIGVAVAAFPVRIGQGGIRSYDFWGRHFALQWDDIKKVEPRNYLGMRYLRVESAPGTAVFIPLGLRDIRGLRERVRQLAGSGNVLTCALDSWIK
jgi:hypothetical protein